MTESDRDLDSATIIVRPVLNSPPVFYGPHWWSESAHQWEGRISVGVVGDKPSATLEVSLDVVLAEVLDRACDAWGFSAGPDQTQDSGHSVYHRVGFVLPRYETEPITAAESYMWGSRFNVMLEDGSEEHLTAHEVTYRQLLVASALGLIEGDVTRPIIQPSMPQGAGVPLSELVQLGADAARIAYAEVDRFFGASDHLVRVIAAATPTANRVADDVVDEGTRVAAVFAFVQGLRKHLARNDKG